MSRSTVFGLIRRFFKGRSILVVEDDLLLKPHLARLLYSVDSDIDLEWTSTVEQAKAALKKGSVDLVIADCLLQGGETGVDLWKYCRKRHPEARFLMISGLADKTIEKLIGDPGMFPEFLQKPFGPKEGITVIRRLLSGGKGGYIWYM